MIIVIAYKEGHTGREKSYISTTSHKDFRRVATRSFITNPFLFSKFYERLTSWPPKKKKKRKKRENGHQLQSAHE